MQIGAAVAATQTPFAAAILTLSHNALQSQLSELCCPSRSLGLAASQWLRLLCLVGIGLHAAAEETKVRQRHNQGVVIVTHRCTDPEHSTTAAEMTAYDCLPLIGLTRPATSGGRSPKTAVSAKLPCSYST